MDSVKESTKEHYKQLVALALFRCYRDFGNLTHKEFDQWRGEYKAWLNGESPQKARADPDRLKLPGDAATKVEKESHG